MAAEGYLHLYTTSRPRDPSNVLRQMLRVSGANSASAWATPSELSEWELFKLSKSANGDFEEIPIRTIGAEVPIGEAHLLSSDEVCLRLDMADTHIDDGLPEEVAKIPRDIRNGFQLAHGLSIWFGWHDIFESAEEENGHLFDRPYISIVFLGFGCPANWQETRNSVFRIEKLRDIQESFEQITGPLRQCLYWDI